jgi:hypothetical protein
MIVNQGVTSSGVKTSDVTITTANKAGLLFGYQFKVGTSASSMLLRNGGASGTILVQDFNVAVTAAGDVHKTVMFKDPIVFSTDIFLDIGGTNAAAVVFYKQIG